MNKIDGKSQAWRDAADKLLEALARDNKYIVALMVQIFLESSGYGLSNYSPLGGVFRRAEKRGIIKQQTKRAGQILWVSKIYNSPAQPDYLKMDLPSMQKDIPDIYKGKELFLQGFGKIDGKYRVVDVDDGKVSLEEII